MTAPCGGVCAHRCTVCGDWDRHHQHTVTTVRGSHRLTAHGGCRVWRCDCTGFVLGPSEVYSLYVGQGHRTGQPIGYLVAPGSRLHGEVSCPCGPCEALHQRLTAEEPADEPEALFVGATPQPAIDTRSTR